MMAARSKAERAVRRQDKAEANRARKNAQRTGKQRSAMMPHRATVAVPRERPS